MEKTHTDAIGTCKLLSFGASIQMVKPVEAKIAMAKKRAKQSYCTLWVCGLTPRLPDQDETFCSTSLSDDIRDMGIPPGAPGAQIALIACCILMSLQMKRTRAAWCLTADNRLGRRGEGPCQGK